MSSLEKKIRVLFIGNSHTYYNDMPELFRERAERDGFACEVTMLAHGGWRLSQHAKEPEVSFNIHYGNYDYVVLQEHAHPFVPFAEYQTSVSTLTDWIRAAGAVPVLYLTWAKKNEQEKQKEMTEAAERMAAETSALLAPVGEHWWEYQKAHPDAAFYQKDDAHATRAGSVFAAIEIWNTIREDIQKKAEQVTGIAETGKETT